MKSLLPTSLILGLYSACAAGFMFILNRSGVPLPTRKTISRRFPLATLLLVGTIALPTTLQFFYPQMLLALQRDYARFLSGDWWRLITPLFVQDGGIAGSIFNLVTLLLVGGVAEKLWGSGRMVCIFFVGGVVAELVAFAWEPIGAGNSLGNLSLAASVAVACLARQSGRIIQIAALVALGADAMLVVLKDIHGAAAAAGVVLAVVLSARLKYRARFVDP